jgi:hypothetical protein
MLVSRPLTIPKILGGEARGRKKVSPAIKWDNSELPRALRGLGKLNTVLSRRSMLIRGS